MQRRTILIVVVALAAGGGAVLGSGAFSSASADRTATVDVAGDANAFLGLDPGTENEDSPYATTTTTNSSNEVLALQFDGGPGESGGEGLGKDSTYQFDNVFTVTNQGPRAVALEYIIAPETDSGNGHDGVKEFRLYNGSDPGEDLNGSFMDGGGTIGPGESITVGVEITTNNRNVTSEPDNEITVRLKSTGAEVGGGGGDENETILPPIETSNGESGG